MDGNGRWAKKRFLPRTAGHKAGAKSVRRIIENCVKHKIAALTLFAFSSENWQRPADEVNALMSLFIEHLQKEIPLFIEHNIKLRVIGDIATLPQGLQQQIQETEATTATHTGLNLNIATSYGGRWDICQATKMISEKVLNGELSLEQISEETVAKHLVLADLPEPDLFIRTSGEQRISNFLLWQLAYTELFFTETLWPDFDTDSFDEALAWFAARQRRFGKTS